MTPGLDEAAIRNWLIDYLVTTIGCSPDDVGFDVSLSDLAVGSADAVVLSGELSELLGRPVSPVDFWQHPTINALARFLAGAEPESAAEVATDPARGFATEPIAVIGLGCRFPGDIAGPGQFWQFLADRRSAVGQVPADRWPAFDDGSPETAAALHRTTRWGSFLGDVDAFDAEFFEISPSEAAKMDPQQRLLLEVTHEALEHAGIPPHTLRHTQTGVFAGACLGEYGYLASTDLSEVDAWSGTGGALSIIANRVSYFFDLRGPSVTVDTACSSSLVAVHLACQSLRTGDANLALAGGVNLLLSPAVTRSFDQADAMSPTGKCHAFDAAADGFVRGEGCGVAVLKRLSDAVADGDRVLAVIRGSAVNQDGRSNGLMAPNPAAQMAVLRAAYSNAGIAPREVDYVEAHGTGTLLGDPIEARALGTVLGRGRGPDTPLLIGAVKSNLGHLEAAAGIAGLIKAVLAVHHGQIPASLHFENPNPHIPFENLRLKVVAQATEWPSADRPRTAGVSSFGFGGTNAHIVLEQGPDPAPVAAADASPAVTTLVVSGKTTDRVASMAAALAGWMDGAGADVPLAEVAYTLDHRRTRHPRVAAVCARDRDQAVAGLRAVAAGQPAPGVVSVQTGTPGPGIVFVYSGQGSQWAGMARRLLTDEPAFAEAIAALEPAFVEQAGFSLQEVLGSGAPLVGIERIQPVLVGVQLALTHLWQSYGVRPDAVIGHSMGEVTASVVAGALSPADGLKVIATRSRLMSVLAGQGAMALLEVDPHSAEELVASHRGITIAVYASPRQTVIAGPPAEIDAVIAIVEGRGRLARRVEVDVASHHPIIDPVLPELRTALADLTPRPPAIPLISTARDQSVDGTITFDGDYWAANLRNPVRFDRAVAAAGADHATFVEVSPHPVLTYAIDDSFGDGRHRAVGTLQRDSDDTVIFHTNLNTVQAGERRSAGRTTATHLSIPATPWHRTRHWVRPRRRAVATAPAPGTLLGEHTTVATAPRIHLWRARLLADARPYPGGHRIRGVEVVPVSVLLQTLSDAARRTGHTLVEDVRFEHPIVLEQPRVVQVVVDGETISVSSTQESDAADTRWVRHLTARLSHAPQAAAPGVARADGDDTTMVLGTASVADLQRSWGVEGQPYAWSVGSCRAVAGGLAADVRLPDKSVVALLDAAVHVARLADSTDPRLLVPSGADGVWLATQLTDPHATVEVRKRRDGGGDLVVDVVATAPDGSIGVDIRSLRYTDVESRPVSGADARSFAHEIDWQPWADEAPSAAPAGGLAVVGEGADGALSARLAQVGYVPASLADARHVVYVATPRPAESDLDAAVRLTAQVSELVRDLSARADRDPARLLIVTRGVHEATSATAISQSALWGLAGVVAAEQPDRWCGLVDLPGGDDVADHAGALAEVLAAPPRTTLLRRDGRFLAPSLVPVSGAPGRGPLGCRPDAAYLVTGGMGALGLLIADWLADLGARRIILAGRTALPPRCNWDDDDNDAETRHRIAAVRALELRGVALDIVAVDIGSPDAVRELLARRDRDGAPPVRGVVHAAGVTENRLLTETDHETLSRVMWPKVAGVMALRDSFPVDQLDFFFLTSSAATVFGVPGQGAYAAANAFLDCFARVRRGEGGHAMSLDWVAWQGRGFGAEAPVVQDELARRGSRPITAQEAFTAWEYVARYDLARAVIAPMPSSDAGSAGTAGVECDAQRALAWAQLDADDLFAELQGGLRAILAAELHTPEGAVDVDTPFAEMGLNSVTAMSIRRQVERLVGVELSATMLWNHPTIDSLASYLANRLLPQQDTGSGGEGGGPADDDVPGGLLDSLFDDVESTTANSEGRS